MMERNIPQCHPCHEAHSSPPSTRSCRAPATLRVTRNFVATAQPSSLRTCSVEDPEYLLAPPVEIGEIVNTVSVTVAVGIS